MKMRFPRLLTAFVVAAGCAVGFSSIARAGGTTLPLADFGSMVVDHDANRIYVSSPTSGSILSLTPDGGLAGRVNELPGALDMVQRGTTLFVALSAGDRIEAIDTRTLGRKGVVASGLSAPRGLVWAGGRLWTTVGQCTKWSVRLASIDLAGAVFTYPMPGTASYCAGLTTSAADPNMILAWSKGLWPGSVYRLDVSGDQPVLAMSGEYGYGTNLADFAVLSQGSLFYGAEGNPYDVYEYALATLTPTGRFHKMGGYPNAVATTSACGSLLAAGHIASEAVKVFVPGVAAPIAVYSFEEYGEYLADRALEFNADGSIFAISERRVSAYNLDLELRFHRLPSPFGAGGCPV